MEKQNGVLDIVDRLSVVIYDNDLVRFFEKLGTLGEIWLMSVDDNEQGVVGNYKFSLFGAYQVFAQACLLRPLYKRKSERCVFVYDDIDGLFQASDYTHNAHRRAESVEVGVSVTHDDDVFTSGYKLGERGGDNSCSDLVRALKTRRNAAEEGIILAVFYGDLISASALRHFDSRFCGVVGVDEAFLLAYTD